MAALTILIAAPTLFDVRDQSSVAFASGASHDMSRANNTVISNASTIAPAVNRKRANGNALTELNTSTATNRTIAATAEDEKQMVRRR